LLVQPGGLQNGAVTFLYVRKHMSWLYDDQMLGWCNVRIPDKNPIITYDRDCDSDITIWLGKQQDHKKGKLSPRFVFILPGGLCPPRIYYHGRKRSHILWSAKDETLERIRND